MLNPKNQFWSLANSKKKKRKIKKKKKSPESGNVFYNEKKHFYFSNVAIWLLLTHDNACHVDSSVRLDLTR